MRSIRNVNIENGPTSINDRKIGLGLLGAQAGQVLKKEFDAKYQRGRRGND